MAEDKIDELERKWKEIFDEEIMIPGPVLDVALAEKCIKARSKQPLEDFLAKCRRDGIVL